MNLLARRKPAVAEPPQSRICACVTAQTTDIAEFHRQLRVAASVSKRLHIDYMDGTMTPTVSPPLAQLSWPGHFSVDLHIMSKHPARGLLELVERTHPRLVIIHAEADGDFFAIADALHARGVLVGVALLPETPTTVLAPALESIDHVMLFSGNLGHFGGQADLRLLHKVTELRRGKKAIEIGWDGGVNDANIVQLSSSGIDVCNVGGYIQKSTNPQKAYATLVAALVKGYSFGNGDR